MKYERETTYNKRGGKAQIRDRVPFFHNHMTDPCHIDCEVGFRGAIAFDADNPIRWNETFLGDRELTYALNRHQHPDVLALGKVEPAPQLCIAGCRTKGCFVVVRAIKGSKPAILLDEDGGQ